MALGTKTHTVYGPLHTSSTPWTQVWTTLTAYAVGQVVKPTNANENGYLFRCVNAGTTLASEPTWNTTPGDPVVDGGFNGELPSGSTAASRSRCGAGPRPHGPV